VRRHRNELGKLAVKMIEEGFDEFWTVYPKKVGKTMAANIQE